ncbi:DEAD box ATP-dependent RNA helicase family member protein [Theileria equi strain WA]|uniref:DEAD box ATP-dependent RNA helicase family member protein n=1 Tax=Theileria equi strain WA TaxID=1537102 RepID=L0AZ13_THEEQ|nr:DEAD box ATP-dependent RNA helicase family member protein [Theileria equi strain WA]AFZ80478.1 DEAD box ATP-dependent RNA helicase family member protein [Theileria equi strain WA]|eukprot:XP_004830144.1 DEAD box ATP-dependent RNA helicase family member protein [Theileria equi strain WA]
MDSQDPESQNEPSEILGNGLKWKSLEIPLDLMSEGLFSLEVLEESDLSPPRTKEKKSKKRKISNKEESILKPTPEPTDEEILRDTSDWVQLAEPDHPIPIAVLRNLCKNDMVSPTDIQRLTLKPSLVENNDIVISSETGSGKTLAFVLPIVLSLLSNRSEDVIESLVLLPTRELAIQVKNIFISIVENTILRVVPIIGGISVQKQTRLLKKNPAIVVATPGRIAEFIEEETEKKPFELKFLVLDEADRFVEDNSFRELQKIVSHVQKPKMRNFICSATILRMNSNLISLFKLLKMKNPVTCVVSDRQQVALPYDELISTGALYKNSSDIKTSMPENLTFKVIKTLENDKELKLIACLVDHLSQTENSRCLIFVNTISYVYRLEALLSLILWKDKHELRIAKSHCVTLNKPTIVDYVTSLHSRLKQKQRLKRLEKFTTHKRAILICTDVASRGIDLPDIDTVVHFQVPKSNSIFVHRSGRTARLQSHGIFVCYLHKMHSGVSICICSCNDMDAWKKLFADIKKDINHVEPLLDCVPPKLYQRYKTLLTLANDIEQEEHKFSKETKIDSWFEKAAREADIELSDYENEAEASAKRSKKYKSMKSGKRKLLEIRSELGMRQ